MLNISETGGGAGGGGGATADGAGGGDGGGGAGGGGAGVDSNDDDDDGDGSAGGGVGVSGGVVDCNDDDDDDDDDVVDVKELSRITMPVIFNEPLSFLERMVEYMEYAELLKQASRCDDPLRRLEVNFVCLYLLMIHNYRSWHK